MKAVIEEISVFLFDKFVMCKFLGWVNYYVSWGVFVRQGFVSFLGLRRECVSYVIITNSVFDRPVMNFVYALRKVACYNDAKE